MFGASRLRLGRAAVAKDLRRIPNPDVTRIRQRIEALREDPRPRGCEKLSGQERYRILYEVLDGRLIVMAVKVAQRKRVYRG